MKRAALCFLAIWSAACGGSDPAVDGLVHCAPPARTWPPSAGTSHVAGADLPWVMGADLKPTCEATKLPATTAPDFFAAVLPVFTETGAGFVTRAKIVRLSTSGDSSSFLTLDDPVEALNTGFLSRVEAGDTTGFVPRGLRLALIAESGGTLLLGNSLTGVLSRVDEDGSRQTVATGLLGVTHLLRRHDGSVLLSLPAIFDGSDVPSVVQQPRLLRLETDGTTSLVFELEAGHEVGSGLLRGLPDGSAVSIGAGVPVAEAPNGDLYIALTYDRSIIRITPDGQGAVAHTDVPFPVGMTVDGSGNLYVTTAPLFTLGGALCQAGTPACFCPSPDVPMCYLLSQLHTGPRVWAIAPDDQRAMLYEGADHPGYQTGFMRVFPEGEVPVDVSLDLFMDAAGNLVLQDALANEVRIIPTN